MVFKDGPIKSRAKLMCHVQVLAFPEALLKLDPLHIRLQEQFIHCILDFKNSLLQVFYKSNLYMNTVKPSITAMSRIEMQRAVRKARETELHGKRSCCPLP
jgi:hypothetical protein